MKLKKIAKALLFPHIAVALLLVPLSSVLLVHSMVFVGTESVTAYISYVLSAYTLTVWCFRAPRVVACWRNLRAENKYVKRWFDDTRLREKTSLYGAFLMNIAYAVFQLWLGFYHSSFWFYSMAGYYISLALMRYFLARYTTRYKPGENIAAAQYLYL